MADELIDLLDEKGNKTGRTVMKHEAHAKGLWHETAHVWIFNDSKEVLLQLRHAKLDGLDNLWDFSCGGHIQHGQTHEEAAIREAKEELGLNLNKKLLKKAFDLKVSNKYLNWTNNEYYRVFIYKIFTKPKFVLQPDEVSDAKFVSIEELEKELKDPVKRKNYVKHDAYWFKALNVIKEELKK